MPKRKQRSAPTQEAEAQKAKAQKATPQKAVKATLLKRKDPKTYSNDAFQVKLSNIKGAGFGVFAKHDFSEGTSLGFYHGVVYLTYPQTNARNYTYFLELHERPPWCSVKQWNAKPKSCIWVDGDCLTAYVNGCMNNKNAWNCDITENGEFVLNADVRKGQEIITCYGSTYWDD
ncbi:SET domain-containing protein [bacterium]|nr:SET domain-containing protein [bacterium]